MRLGNVVAPSAGRMFGRISSPFQKPLVDKGDPLATAAAALAQKTTGGAVFPEQLIMQNLYTNERQANVATFSGGGQQGDDWWEAIRGSVANEFGWPAPVQDAYKNQGWYQLMQETGYNVGRDFLQKVNGIPLDLKSQADLSRDIAALGLGDALSEYYNGEFKPLWKMFQKERKKSSTIGGVPGIPIPLNADAKILLDRIRADIKEIHEKFKQTAVESGSLSQNVEFMNRYLEGKFNQTTSFEPGAEDRGLYAYAAEQDTPLAKQVRDLLDFA